ncbi:hypothetical protein [Streptomyces sp. NPDC059455]|uniref:hypothetical protein n=1 Tax=Streptomyces sp. NPDC059455 TaxID=3346837 RepID=UPI0036B035DD
MEPLIRIGATSHQMGMPIAAPLAVSAKMAASHRALSVAKISTHPGDFVDQSAGCIAGPVDVRLPVGGCFITRGEHGTGETYSAAA